MSFDIHFVRLEAGETFEEAMRRVEESAADESPLTTADLERWDSVVTHVQPLLSDAEHFVGEAHRELTDLATGMQVSLSPGELNVTVPYWYDGPDARDMSARLRSVAIAIETATGLTAYDPQADAPFVGAGELTAASTFDQVHAAFTHDPEPAVDSDERPRRRLFRKHR